MRLGQLARKINKKPSEVISLLKSEFNLELTYDLNARIEDEHVNSLLNKMGISNVVSEDELREEIVAPAVIESAPIETVEEPIQIEDTQESTIDDSGNDPFKPLPVDPNAELIKAPKIKLEGLKVVGKIELKEPVQEVKAESEDSFEVNTGSVNKSKKGKEEDVVEDEANSIYKDKKGIYHFSQTQRENRIKSIERIKLEKIELKRKEKKAKHYQTIAKVSEVQVERQKTKKQKENKVSAKEVKPVRKGVWGKFLNWLND